MRMRVISVKRQSRDIESWKLLFWHTSSLSHDNISTPSSMCRQSCFVEPLPHPSLSSFKLGVRYWKEGSLWIWRQITEQSEPIRSWLIIRSLLAPLHILLAWSPPLFFSFCRNFLPSEQSNEWDWARDVIVLRHFRWFGERRVKRHADSRGVVCGGKSWLTSRQWKLIPYSCRAAAMCGVSQVEDSAIRNVLICMPIVTLMTLSLQYGMKERWWAGRKKKERKNTLGLDIFYRHTDWFKKCPCVQ